MGVLDGQKANQTSFNTAFMARNNDTDTSGVLSLKNTTDPNSGSQVTNAQRAINELEDTVGQLGEGDTNRKVYSSNNVVSNGDNRKVAIGKLDARFGSVAPMIDLTFRLSFTLSASSATNVTTLMTGLGAAASNSDTQEGFAVDSFNLVIFLDQTTMRPLLDASGRRVFGRLTEVGGTWTLSHYVNIAGTETAYTFSGTQNVYGYLWLRLPTNLPTRGSAQSLLELISVAPVDDVPVVVGDSGSGGKKGLVPAPASGDAAAGKFLKADGTWGAPAGGGGGGGSLEWLESANSPTPTIDNSSSGIPLRTYLFQSGLGQSLYSAIKVPSSYAGAQIFIKLEFFSPDSSGTALIQSVATLIRSGTDLISSTTNQRTSSNAAVTLGAGTVNIPQSLSIDLTDSAGKINSVSVSAGDLILVQITRGTDTATSDLHVPVYGAEVKTS